MFATRRLVTLSVAACMVPPPRPALAEELRDKVARLNRRDTLLEKEKEVEELSKWNAIKDATKLCELHPRIIDELHYLHIMYEKPLDPGKKVRARNALLRVYEEAQDDTEKDVILDVMNYYELFE